MTFVINAAAARRMAITATLEDAKNAIKCAAQRGEFRREFLVPDEDVAGRLVAYFTANNFTVFGPIKLGDNFKVTVKW